MSIEMILFPKKATKSELESHLASHGFSTSSHFWKWPPGSIHFAWFEVTDFKSLDGVEATIYRPARDDVVGNHGVDWALHTRTRIWASSFDKEKQNDVIRTARKKFGGSFTNDWHGTNRYIPVDPDLSTPVERGIRGVYSRITDQLNAVEVTLPVPIIALEESAFLREITKQVDPTRILYNALLPFTVAALEHFFGQVFRILLRYDGNVHQRIMTANRRVDFADVLAISEGVMTIEDLVADAYSFQNVDAIHKAYDDWHGIKFRKLLRDAGATPERVNNLDEVLLRIIESRHRLVHRFEFDLELGREEFKEILGTARLIMDALIDYLENERDMSIRAERN